MSPESGKVYYQQNREKYLARSRAQRGKNPQHSRDVRNAWRKRQHPLYRIWCGMKKRCYDPKKDNFSDYGGRGITVCKEWCLSFASFKVWALASGWKPGLLLDREDNGGNYEPGNCRFVTASGSARNRRSSKLKLSDVIEIKEHLDAGLPQRKVARKYGVSQQLISNIVRGKCWNEGGVA